MAAQPAIPFSGTYTKMQMWIRTPTKVISEVHWNEQTGALPSSPVVKSAIALVKLRIACLPKDCTLEKWSLSRENVYGDSWSTDDLQAQAGPIAGSENEGNDCIQVLFHAGTEYRRSLYMAAIPDDAVNDDVYSIGGVAAFDQAFVKYLYALAGKVSGGVAAPTGAGNTAGWGYMPILNSGVSVPRRRITKFRFTPDADTFRVELDGNSQCSVGEVCRISGVQNVSEVYPMDQLFTVADVTDATKPYLLGLTPRATFPDPVPTGGYFQRKVRVFRRYTDAAILEATTRNRGIRALSPLGRKKRKKTIGY